MHDFFYLYSFEIRLYSLGAQSAKLQILPKFSNEKEIYLSSGDRNEFIRNLVSSLRHKHDINNFAYKR